MKPILLVTSANMARLLDGALEDAFEIVRLWEAGDADALLAARGPDVLAMLTVGKEPVAAAFLDRLPNLRVIAVPGAGYEGIDVAAARSRDIRIANAGAAHSGDVADHAVALALAAIQRLPEQDAWLRADRWRGEGLPPRRRAVSAERFGIVGLGHIGAEIGRRLVPFGGEIAWWGPNAKPAQWPRRDSLLDLAGWCTTLIVAARGDAERVIDRAAIDAVGADGLIVNVSRGQVIDEDALIEALRDGRLGYAALDVFAAEPTPPERWAGVPNVLLTPHSAGFTDQAMLKLRDAAIRNLRAAVDGGPLVNEVTA